MADRREYYKEYYSINKEKMKQQIRSNYERKKDIINRKIKCNKCGRVVMARMYKSHLLTNIHNETDYNQDIKICKNIIGNNAKSENGDNGYAIFK